MSRIGRIVVPGFPHHVTQCGMHASIDEGGILPVGLADRSREPIGRARHQDEMHVLGIRQYAQTSTEAVRQRAASRLRYTA